MLAPDNEDAAKNLQALMNRRLEGSPSKSDSLNDAAVSGVDNQLTALNIEESGQAPTSCGKLILFEFPVITFRALPVAVLHSINLSFGVRLSRLSPSGWYLSIG